MTSQYLRTNGAAVNFSVLDTTTTGNISFAESQTSGTLDIGTSASRTGAISVGNNAVSGGPISISAGTGGSSTLTLQGTNGIALTSAASVSGLLSTTAGITNTNTVITSTPGITFGGSTLSTYETGVFTPAYAVTGTGSFNYTTQAGQYTRIGDIVYVWAKIVATLANTPPNFTVSGISGLPITVNGANQSLSVHGCTAFGTAATNFEKRSLYLDDAATTGVFKFVPSSGATAASEVVAADWPTTTSETVIIQGSYMV